MSRERDEFMIILSKELPEMAIHHLGDLGRALMMHRAKLHRLAEAECNGAYPYHGGYRETMIECGACGTWNAFASVSRKGNVCRECRSRAAVVELLKGTGITPIFGGDPRGCVLKLKMPSGYTNDWGREGVCVP